VIVYLLRKTIMDLNNMLNQYLGKQIRISQRDNGDGTKEVCDLDTGDCYVVRERDGLIERAGNQHTANRKVRVETPQGIKQLLNG
jgi:hypothetical protein